MPTQTSPLSTWAQVLAAPEDIKRSNDSKNKSHAPTKQERPSTASKSHFVSTNRCCGTSSSKSSSHAAKDHVGAAGSSSNLSSGAKGHARARINTCEVVDQFPALPTNPTLPAISETHTMTVWGERRRTSTLLDPESMNSVAESSKATISKTFEESVSYSGSADESQGSHTSKDARKKPIKVTPEVSAKMRKSANGTTTLVRSKPKPQENVSVFDFLDLAMANKTASISRSGAKAISNSNIARSTSAPRQRVNVTGRSGNSLHTAALRPATKSSTAGTESRRLGLEVTQRRGKEKEGPKKIRLSKMKKRILHELMEKYETGSTPPLPQFAILEAAAEARLLAEKADDLSAQGSKEAADDSVQDANAKRHETAKKSGAELDQATYPGGDDADSAFIVDDDNKPLGPLVRPKEAVSAPLLVREYVKQIVCPRVNTAATQLLAELYRFQERAHIRDPQKSALRKRYVCGLREVARALRSNKARALIVAHNIERIESEDGLDDAVMELIDLCKRKLEWVYDEEAKAARQQLVQRETPIPITFALTRKLLARALSRPSKTSVVAVLNYDGANDHFASLREVTDLAVAAWNRLSFGVAGADEKPRTLVQYKLRGGATRVNVDPLLFAPRLGLLDDADDLSCWL